MNKCVCVLEGLVDGTEVHRLDSMGVIDQGKRGESVQCPDCLMDETVLQPGGVGLEALESSPRLLQF